jgi:hypothetical protein
LRGLIRKGIWTRNPSRLGLSMLKTFAPNKAQ